MKDKLKYTFIFPAFNESEALQENFLNLVTELTNIVKNPEFILVDDGSTDETFSLASKIFSDNAQALNFTYQLLQNKSNRGYGYSIKFGMRCASHDLIILLDPDGQHIASDLLNLLNAKNSHNLVIGKRQKHQGSPKWRIPGKWVISNFIKVLTGCRLPDPFSGFRIWNRSDFLKISSLLSDGFSVGTSSVLAAHYTNIEIEWVDIKSKKRLGKSTVKIKDGFQTLFLIIKIVNIFSPLRVFGSVGTLTFIGGISYIIYSITVYDIISVRGLFLLLFGVLFIFQGFVLDQISALRRQVLH